MVQGKWSRKLKTIVLIQLVRHQVRGGPRNTSAENMLIPFIQGKRTIPTPAFCVWPRVLAVKTFVETTSALTHSFPPHRR
eukprot:6483628-Amphidinium_carterae.1